MTEKSINPLVVDLDGTLIKTDLLIESFLGLVKKNPLYLINVFIWLLQGKATLKREIAERVDIDVEVLPYNDDVIALIKEQRRLGRRIVLATASYDRYARAVSDHLGLFDEVIATTANYNLSGTNKRNKLVEYYGENAYDYVGNANPDIDVWRSAANAIVVSSDEMLCRRAGEVTTVERHIVVEKPNIKVYVKAMRLHQWLKNALILVPLVTAHQLFNYPLVAQALLAFLAFGLCASSVYLLNDLLDLTDDRHHKTKRLRPFAAGAIPVLNGVILAPILLLSSIILAAFLPTNFMVVLAIYYVMTTAYSFKLKKLVLVDVIVLAMLYTIRIIGGAAAIEVAPSFWLLAFSLFIFHSLAIVKRCTELGGLKGGGGEKMRGRGYGVSDIELLYFMGNASGYISVLVLALYVNSDTIRTLYSLPEAIWLLCPIMLYWVSRVWILAHRGEMHDDPIVFALTDNISRITVILMGLVFVIAI